MALLSITESSQIGHWISLWLHVPHCENKYFFFFILMVDNGITVNLSFLVVGSLAESVYPQLSEQFLMNTNEPIVRAARCKMLRIASKQAEKKRAFLHTHKQADALARRALYASENSMKNSSHVRLSKFTCTHTMWVYPRGSRHTRPPGDSPQMWTSLLLLPYNQIKVIHISFFFP